MFSYVSSHRHVLPLLSRSRLLFLGVVLWTLLAACGQGGGASTPSPSATPTIVRDVYGTPVTFPTSAPRRIVSLSPSMSEILGALQLSAHVVGVDFYTTSPASLTSKPRISDANGTYNLEQIVALKPDLVLSDGGLTKPYDSKLAGLGLHVVDLPATSLSAVLQKILVVGRLTFTQSAAQTLVNQLQVKIDSIKTAVAGTPSPKVLLELDDSTPGKPYVFGGSSFGDELLQDANGTNVFHSDTTNGGYPQVTDEAVIAANPQFIILTEDPHYGGDPTQVYQRANWSGIAAVQSHKVYALNVNIMQHPSQRLVDGLYCLVTILHPDKYSSPLPDYCTASV